MRMSQKRMPYANETPPAENTKPIDEELLQKRLTGDFTEEQKTPDFAYAAFQRGQYLTAFQIALPLAEKEVWQPRSAICLCVEAFKRQRYPSKQTRGYRNDGKSSKCWAPYCNV